MVLNRVETEQIRNEISRSAHIWGGSISVFENGKFEIRGIDETDANRVYSALLRMENVRNLYKSGKYNFSHFSPMGLPKREFTISGDYCRDLE